MRSSERSNLRDPYEVPHAIIMSLNWQTGRLRAMRAPMSESSVFYYPTKITCSLARIYQLNRKGYVLTPAER